MALSDELAELKKQAVWLEVERARAKDPPPETMRADKKAYELVRREVGEAMAVQMPIMVEEIAQRLYVPSQPTLWQRTVRAMTKPRKLSLRGKG